MRWIFASARLRRALRDGPGALVDFHTRYKLVLMAHSPHGQRELGRLVAEAGNAFDDVAYPLALGSDAMASPEFSTSVAVLRRALLQRASRSTRLKSRLKT